MSAGFSPQALARALDALTPEVADRARGASPASTSWRTATLCVAFSGGADSVALLAAIAQLRRDGECVALRAIHVDHGLHPASGSWAAHCRAVARSLDVPLGVARVRVERVRGESLEANARAARYGALRQRLRRGEWLLTAHHAEDQLETMLLQLVRGAGVAGLAAMPAAATFGRALLVRPLLDVARADLRQWVASQRLAVIEDPSNLDERFDRNYLRRAVLPALTTRWPAAAKTAVRSARHCAEASDLIDALARFDLATVGSGDALDVSRLGALPLPRRRNVLRHWLAAATLPLPDARQLAEVIGPLCRARGDATPVVRWPGAEVRRYRGLLFALAPFESLRRGEWRWRRDRRFSLGPGLGVLEIVDDPEGPIALARLPANLSVDVRRPGEVVRTDARGPSHRVKELLRAGGVPPWLRDRLPVIRAGARPLLIADRWVAAEVHANPRSRARARLRWHASPLPPRAPTR